MAQRSQNFSRAFFINSSGSRSDLTLVGPCGCQNCRRILVSANAPFLPPGVALTSPPFRPWDGGGISDPQNTGMFWPLACAGSWSIARTIGAVTRSRSAAIDGPISDLEPRFICSACGKRGVDVRPNFHWVRKRPARRLPLRRSMKFVGPVRARVHRKFSDQRCPTSSRHWPRPTSTTALRCYRARHKRCCFGIAPSPVSATCVPGVRRRLPSGPSLKRSASHRGLLELSFALLSPQCEVL